MLARSDMKQGSSSSIPIKALLYAAYSQLSSLHGFFQSHLESMLNVLSLIPRLVVNLFSTTLKSHRRVWYHWKAYF